MFLRSKIIKLNSLFIQQKPKMKKATYTVIMILICMLSFMSCEKEYHCGCTFNNTVVYTKDLGYQYKNNAKKLCDSYDSTITGEVWNCMLY